ncbi:MAG: CHAD domain-containing protein [Bacteriovorax sp.]|nr:CHAD domain-containing protein [Bacteriovorax sp.]
MDTKSTNKTIYLCLAESLKENGASYIELLKSVRKNVSEESVHEIRVTIRKLEACLELLDSLGIRHKNLSKDLRHIRKIHGPIRNMHVELESIKNIEDMVNLKPFKIYLKKHVKKFEKNLLKELDHFSLEKKYKEIQKIVDKLLKKDIPVLDEKAINPMETKLQKTSKEFEKSKKSFSPNIPKSIHAIRITAKKLRYQGEILKPAINFDNINLRELKRLQATFGNIQNNNVLQKSINKYLRKNSNKGSRSVLKLQTYIAKEQNNLVALASKIKGMKEVKEKK